MPSKNDALFELFNDFNEYTTIYKDEEDTTPSSSLFTKNICGYWEDDGAVSGLVSALSL